MTLVHVSHHTLSNRAYILQMIPQRRHLNGEYVEPIVQVTTQLPFRNSALWILVGRRDHPYIHGGLRL